MTTKRKHQRQPIERKSIRNRRRNYWLSQTCPGLRLCAETTERNQHRRRRIKGLSIESLLWGNGDGALKVFGDRGGLGITFWAPPYPKIGGRRIYSGFSRARGSPSTFAPLYYRIEWIHSKYKPELDLGRQKWIFPGFDPLCDYVQERQNWIFPSPARACILSGSTRSCNIYSCSNPRLVETGRWGVYQGDIILSPTSEELATNCLVVRNKESR